MDGIKDEFSRMGLMLPKECGKRLERAHVAVFGVGGVGGAVCEALARAGVGCITLVDRDAVDITNINRQLIALHSTVGRAKVEVMRERILDINPDCRVVAREMFFLPENAAEFDFSQFDYIADAVDTVAAKLEIICRANHAGVPVISAMGAGNKLEPTAFRVADIYQTSVCPLARVMRAELKRRGVERLKVVYSTETPRRAGGADIEPNAARIEDDMTGRGEGRSRTPGSVSFVPPVAGFILAGEILKDLMGFEENGKL